MGYDAIPNIFRRNIAILDIAPVGAIHTTSSRYIATFRKYWLVKEKRYMTLEEIFESGAGYFEGTRMYEDLGIKWI